MSEFHKGQLGQFVGFLAQEYGFGAVEAATKLKAYFPELRDKSQCGNCGASMLMYEHSIDIMDAKLLLAMGEVVVKQSVIGTPFNVANRVHVQSLKLTYAEKSRTTWCSKLGLIAKVKNAKGEHDRKAGWLITSRGFAFLRNEDVPKRVVVWRNEIQDRFPERTTIGEILKEGYNVEEWFEVGKIVQGNLL